MAILSVETMSSHMTNGDSSILSTAAQAVGAPEAAIRLLLSILAGYPVSAVYRTTIVYKKQVSLHNLFFFFCGISLCIFNYGFDTYHSAIAILTTYVLMRLLHTLPYLLVSINFVFHMSYLLLGYYFTESNEYDIIWTMPHCVLVLRMIGLGFDIFDGRKPLENLSKNQQETALSELPSLLELLAFAYFPYSFLVGPQFPFSRYKQFIHGEYRQYKGCVEKGLQRMSIGFFYLFLRQIGSRFLPDSYLITDSYRELSFISRLYCLGLWGKLSLYKYVSCWLLTEGALMCSGFTYAGKDYNGDDDWSGCSNVKLKLLESANTMQNYVQSFNVNTNQWLSEYIYKRLKFLNNRMISHATALLFLAVWHGFHSGYYMSFLIEYMIMTTEKEIESVYYTIVLPRYGNILEASIIYNSLKFIVLKSYNIIYMGWCLVPFVFLSYSRWMQVYSAVNYFGFIYIGVCLFACKLCQYKSYCNKKKHN